LAAAARNIPNDSSIPRDPLLPLLLLLPLPPLLLLLLLPLLLLLLRVLHAGSINALRYQKAERAGVSSSATCCTSQFISLLTVAYAAAAS
jgi:ABC-type sulfate transport system permease component